MRYEGRLERSVERSATRQRDDDEVEDDDDGGGGGDDDDVDDDIFRTLTGGAASEQSPQQAPSSSHTVRERADRPTDQPLKRHVTTVRLCSRRRRRASLPSREAARKCTKSRRSSSPLGERGARGREGGGGKEKTRGGATGGGERVPRIREKDARDKERETAAGILNDTRTERKMDGRGEGIFFYYSSRDTLLIDKRLEDECTCACVRVARERSREGRKNSAVNVQ